MRELLARTKRTLVQVIIVAAIGLTVLYALGKPHLLLPFAGGILIGAIYWLYYGYRFFFAKRSSMEEVGQSLQGSVIVRWLLLVVIVVFANRESSGMLFAILGGLLLMFIMMLVNLIIFACRDANKQK